MREGTGGLGSVQSAGNCPVSHVWLCSLGGGEIRRQLNLGNLIRDFFRVYSFPTVLASSSSPAQFP